MRVLITVPWAQSLGGAETMLQTILDGLGETCHQVELVFFEDGPWARELARAGHPVTVVRTGRIREPHRWLLAVTRLAGILRRRRPDLILNWAAKTQLYGSPAAVLAGMRGRVLWWQHNLPSGHWIDRWATRLPAIAIGASSGACAKAQAALAPTRPTFVVMPGVSPVPGQSSSRSDVLSPPSGQAHDRPVIGLVGRLQPWKGQDRLLRAQAILRERGHRTQVLLVGGDAHGLSPEYAQSLPPLIDRLGLTEEVTMTGQVDDAGPYIDGMDILVNASESEPFGIVLLEGMARGVPVVAVDAGGPAELIEHGSTGVLARSGEPEQLADALEELVRSSDLRRRLGAAGRDHYMREFTDEAMRRRFFDQLEGVRRIRPHRDARVSHE